MDGPLEGSRIVDLTAMVSGPIATMMLADQGADVIKVEPPGQGDLVRAIGEARSGITPLFATSNRGKRSISIDLKRAEGVALLKRLVATADVFAQNFRPGTAERMGIGESALRAVAPNLIYVSINGFGEQGPYAQQRVYDPVIQAASGLAAVQRDRKTGRPQMVRTIVADKLTALTAAQAMTAALLSRERTGEGQHVRLAMLDAMVSFLWPEGMLHYTFARDGDEFGRRDHKSPIRDLVFETSDGFITAGTVSDAEWAGFARAAQRPDLIGDPRFATGTARVENWDERLELMSEILRGESTAHWLERLDAEQVPCAPILECHELLTDAQIAANGLIEEIDHPQAGRIRHVRPAARFDRTAARVRGFAPTLGQHTDEVLAEIGIGEAEITSLRAAGTVF
ncbi:MAG: CoA transferase [Deltaproteobacteria bacterium]|jgi:crotonobetainyl-CoA:carnitine CoA-transferase CaiB-like acyl-CoA transferase|nr:CoA transferase [Deltaproteobacteria bacterium]